jgi:MoaA/NifB/PqqE/SkfB family radical SAM enzyme
MCLKNNTKLKTMIDYGNPCEMEYSVLEKFLRQHADYLCLVRLHGGEPLYYKDITRLIDLLNELKIPFNIITNGSLLTQEVSQQLLNSYCVGLGFSLDAGQRDTYANIRKGGDLDAVAANIDYLHELKRKTNSKRPVFSASMCTFSFNIREMAEVVEFCNTHHIPALSIVEGWDYKTEDIQAEHLIANHIEATHKFVREALRDAKTKGVLLRITFPSLSKKKYKDIPYHAGKIKPKNCLNLYSAAWLLPTFDIIGCSSATSSLGNIKKTNFKEVWNSQAFGYAQAREEFRKKQVPPFCNECIYTGGFFS